MAIQFNDGDYSAIQDSAMRRTNALFDTAARAGAGRALASGDQRGATNALYRAGMINEGQGIEDRAAAAQKDEVEKAKVFYSTMDGAAKYLRSQPDRKSVV